MNIKYGAYWAQRRIIGIIMLVAMSVLTISCATTGTSTGSDDIVEQSVRPGTKGWDDTAAMMLPADSPFVVGVHIRDIIDTVRNGLLWLTDEPEMFGEHGEYVVRHLMWQWQSAVESIGVDPLAPPSWTSRGIDIARPVYVGGFPLSGHSGQAYVDAVETVLFEQMESELASGELSLLEAMRSYMERDAADVRGLYADIHRAIQSIDPVSGFRILIPISDQKEALSYFDDLARSLGYDTLDAELVYGKNSGEEPTVVYYSESATFPSFTVRPEAGDNWGDGDYLVLDWIASPMSHKQSARYKRTAFRERVLEHLREVSDFPTGRPAAPMPVEAQPSLFFAYDQAEMALLAALRAYSISLQEVSELHVERRDSHLLEWLIMSLESSYYWEILSDSMPGTTYSLSPRCIEDIGDESCIVSVQMGLFGEDGLPVLNLDESHLTLGVQDRSWGLSMATTPFFDESWQQWIRMDSIWEIYDSLYEDTDVDPLVAMLGWPRQLALLLVHADILLDQDWDYWESPPSIEQFEGVIRTEVGSVHQSAMNADEGAFPWQMPFIHLWELDASYSEDERDRLAGRVHALISQSIAEQYQNKEGVDANKIALEQPIKDGLSRLGNKTAPIFYYYDTNSERPFMFFAYGLSADDAQYQLNQVVHHTREDSQPLSSVAFRAHIEPLIAARLINRLMGPTDIVDMHVLMQRIGAMVFMIWPDSSAEPSRIRFGFELKAPLMQ